MHTLSVQLAKAVAIIIIGGFLLTVLLTTVFPTAQPFYSTMSQYRMEKNIKLPPPSEATNDTNSGTVSH